MHFCKTYVATFSCGLWWSRLKIKTKQDSSEILKKKLLRYENKPIVYLKRTKWFDDINLNDL